MSSPSSSSKSNTHIQHFHCIHYQTSLSITTQVHRSTFIKAAKPRRHYVVAYHAYQKNFSEKRSKHKSKFAPPQQMHQSSQINLQPSSRSLSSTSSRSKIMEQLLHLLQHIAPPSLPEKRHQRSLCTLHHGPKQIMHQQPMTRISTH